MASAGSLKAPATTAAAAADRSILRRYHVPLPSVLLPLHSILGAGGKHLHDCTPSCGVQWLRLLVMALILEANNIMPVSYTCSATVELSCRVLHASWMSLNPVSVMVQPTGCCFQYHRSG